MAPAYVHAGMLSYTKLCRLHPDNSRRLESMKTSRAVLQSAYLMLPSAVNCGNCLVIDLSSPNSRILPDYSKPKCYVDIVVL
jgi:hypothetical protein